MPGSTAPTGTPYQIHELAEQAARLVAPLLPSRSSVRSTSEESENPISPPNTTAYSVVRLQPDDVAVEALCDQQGGFEDAPTLPSPITTSGFSWLAFLLPVLLRMPRFARVRS
jgi:hypothetical protein